MGEHLPEGQSDVTDLTMCLLNYSSIIITITYSMVFIPLLRVIIPYSYNILMHIHYCTGHARKDMF